MTLGQSVPRTYVAKLTRDEARALRLALIFGCPDPEPDTVTSARAKLQAIELRAAKQESR